MLGWIMPIFSTDFKKIGNDLLTSLKLLKSSLVPSYPSCNMQHDIAKDEVIETKSKLNIKFKHNHGSDNYYIYFISKKYLLDAEGINDDKKIYG